MNYLIILLCILLYHGQLFTNMCSDDFSAVSYSVRSSHLFDQLRNTDPPSESDPAATNAEIRRRICEDITGSEIFNRMNLVPINLAELFHNWNAPGYVDLFFYLYQRVAHENVISYTNPYREVKFKRFNGQEFIEHAFACPIRDTTNNRVFHGFVSKTYNVGPSKKTYLAGRFVFGKFVFRNAVIYSPLLAEHAAQTYTEVGFNVESHYLHIRKYVQTAERDDVDPLCKLISGDVYDTPHHRLCVTLGASSSFKNEYKYPLAKRSSCSSQLVSFRTPEGVAGAAAELYQERMAQCYFGGDRFLYISRAYQSTQLFVYKPDSSGSRIYLENLSLNMCVEDELNSFDFVEE